MPQVTIYHNPRCSKSRQTLQLLRDRGIEPAIVEYLDNPPDADTLRRIIAQLGIQPADLLRKGESMYKELDLAGKDDQTLITAMTSHPILIERPIVISGNRAALGRPPENVLALI